MTVRVVHGDLRDRIPELIAEGVRVDAVVTDPPYHLTQTSRGAHAKTNNPGSPAGRHRIGDKGFMGKEWDGGDDAMQPATWGIILDALKPGGHLVAFGGTRTHHRMMCAIEDAGFEIRDVLMWVYGSGFPKSKNYPEEFPGMGTALKPAWEPIILARKPLAGNVADNMRAHGVGMLQIDGCRIEGAPEPRGTGGIPCRNDSKGPSRRPNEASGQRRYADVGGTNFAATPGLRGGDPKGRWPANVAHDGSPDVVALFPFEAGAAAPVRKRNGDKFRSTYGAFSGDIDEAGSTFQGDVGSAARFFYCAKADRTDRNEGCEHLQAKALNWSSGTESPGTFQADGADRTSPNHHPTVKPTALMRWLIRLITPCGGLVLDPFAGSGSTGKAAVLESRSAVLIEREAEYVEIARARIAHSQGPLFSEVA